MLDMHQIFKRAFDPATDSLRFAASGPFSTAVSDTGAAEMDLAAATNFFIELIENTELTFASPVDGKKFTVVVKQDAGGSNALTFADDILWEGGTEPTVTQTGDAVDVFSFLFVDALDAFVGSVIQDFQAP